MEADGDVQLHFARVLLDMGERERHIKVSGFPLYYFFLLSTIKKMELDEVS